MWLLILRELKMLVFVLNIFSGFEKAFSVVYKILKYLCMKYSIIINSSYALAISENLIL